MLARLGEEGREGRTAVGGDRHTDADTAEVVNNEEL